MTGVFRGRLWGCGGLIELSDIGWPHIFHNVPTLSLSQADRYQVLFRIASNIRHAC